MPLLQVHVTPFLPANPRLAVLERIIMNRKVIFLAPSMNSPSPYFHLVSFSHQAAHPIFHRIFKLRLIALSLQALALLKAYDHSRRDIKSVAVSFCVQH